MKAIYKIFLSLILGFFLTSCGSSSGVGTKFEFDGEKNYGLLAYDIYFIGEISPNYAIQLFPYDKETGTIDINDRKSTGCGFVCNRSGSGVQFYIGAIDPGSYVIGYLFYAHSFGKRFVCFPERTIQFDIEPGKVHYLGEMTFNMDHPLGRSEQQLEVFTHDLDHVKARLAKYPTVLAVDRYRYPDGMLRSRVSTKPNAEIVVLPINYVSYEPGERKREISCIKGYVD